MASNYSSVYSFMPIYVFPFWYFSAEDPQEWTECRWNQCCGRSWAGV